MEQDRDPDLPAPLTELTNLPDRHDQRKLLEAHEMQIVEDCQKIRKIAATDYIQGRRAQKRLRKAAGRLNDYVDQLAEQLESYLKSEPDPERGQNEFGQIRAKGRAIGVVVRSARMVNNLYRDIYQQTEAAGMLELQKKAQRRAEEAAQSPKITQNFNLPPAQPKTVDSWQDFDAEGGKTSGGA